METTKNTQKQEAGQDSKRKKAAGIAGICLVVLGLGAIVSLFVEYRSSETTDDAQIEQYLSPVNIRVPATSSGFALPSISMCAKEIRCLFWKRMNIASN